VAAGRARALAGAALTATISVHAEGVVMTAGGAVIPPGTSPSTATLLTYLDRLLTMPAESLAALAFAVQQFLTGVISDWRAEFESAGVLVLPLLLILVVRRMKP